MRELSLYCLGAPTLLAKQRCRHASVASCGHLTSEAGAPEYVGEYPLIEKAGDAG